MVDDIVAQYLAAQSEVWRATESRNGRLVNAAYNVAEEIFGRMSPEQATLTCVILAGIRQSIDERLTDG